MNRKQLFRHAYAATLRRAKPAPSPKPKRRKLRQIMADLAVAAKLKRR